MSQYTEHKVDLSSENPMNIQKQSAVMDAILNYTLWEYFIGPQEKTLFHIGTSADYKPAEPWPI